MERFQAAFCTVHKSLKRFKDPLKRFEKVFAIRSSSVYFSVTTKQRSGTSLLSKAIRSACMFCFIKHWQAQVLLIQLKRLMEKMIDT